MYARIELGFDYNYTLLSPEIYPNISDVFKKKNLEDTNAKKKKEFSVLAVQERLLTLISVGQGT